MSCPSSAQHWPMKRMNIYKSFAHTNSEWYGHLHLIASICPPTALHHTVLTSYDTLEN